MSDSAQARILTELELVGTELAAARNALDAHVEQARVAATAALAAGVSERAAARALGVSRKTLRRWEGK